MVICFAFCGSFCTHGVAIRELRNLLAAGYEVLPIMSETVWNTDTRFGSAATIMQEIETLCGTQGIKSIAEAEQIGPKKLFDLFIIAPCTGNTLAKLSLGIIDATVPMAVKAHLRNARPLVIAPASNDALSVGLRHIGTLLLRKNIFFVPFGQDDPFGKPTSLIADFEKLPQTVACAFENKQLQPLLLKE